MYDEIVQTIINMAEMTGVSIVLGSLPPDNGIAMIGNATTNSVFLDIGGDFRLNLVCNGKNADQQTVIQQLDNIHAFLTRRKDFPNSSRWQIYSISTTASPRLIGREANSQWLYGSSLLVKFCVKGITK